MEPRPTRTLGERIVSPDYDPPPSLSIFTGVVSQSQGTWRRREPRSAPAAGSELSTRARAGRLRTGRSLRAPAAWKAPHVQAPRSRLRRFPAMNWASESEPPARLRAQCTAPGAGDGRPPKSTRIARVRFRRPPAKHPGAWLGAPGCGLSAGCPSQGSGSESGCPFWPRTSL